MSEPGKQREVAEGWGCSFEKSQTREEREETRGNGGKDSRAAQNRGYRRVMKQSHSHQK